MKELTITGIYDNTVKKGSLLAGWGFSVLLTGSDFRILFDVGADVAILKRNMKRLKVSPVGLDAVVLSHPHCDHVGGLSAVLREESNLTVYLTESFPERLKKTIIDYGAEPATVSEPEEIRKGVFTTGQFFSNYRGTKLPEQGLVLETEKGPVLIPGCAHPGIVRMIERTRDIADSPPHLALGGFHLGGKESAEIKRIIGRLARSSVEKLAPTHCTGQKATAMIEEKFEEDFFEFGAGAQIGV